MTADNDLINLYSTRILALASDIPHTERLATPDATVKRRAPLCGSTVTVDLCVNDGEITDYGQDVKACALGQAAASVVGANIIGRNRQEIERARDQLRDMLKNDGPTPSAPFEGLEVLRPAQSFRNRHASILLAIEASLEAMTQAENASCA
ncbi:iron-sulfur cluster assembly scaffold protein [Pseudohalocynthiibacter aestuariivivens]|jgi:NifU-like protein involved in Fe-S cluster formation|uniref:Iron-sulfur cluster assembly scaffold protein n=1 Tax=Pseudohalocynthiibacter aestuariivivens TaxID=1591409 RepID=A0ABV5JGA3_9RHOB|nr:MULTISPECIES: iron-sulfur cluster assembly scaffold protein [Pseudohalocynthiibacter]MBS9716186.1 iron-sulfur cluster assembly scaffold protein [Pseudohalocynthiibacter aestuariivivens]MCK0101006.1 iron-sulfur cluster assembly scaffold protein [Pseudohalocynthiibacter sp. F2068]